MRRSGLFWGIILVLGGGLLLLNTTGVLKFNIWGVFFPLFVVALGVWFLVGPMIFRNEKLEESKINIPLQGASSASLVLKHGAGRIQVGALPMETGNFLEGSFAGGVAQKVERPGSRLDVVLKVDRDVVFGVPTMVNREGFAWAISLSRSLPLEMEVETGASETTLDLRDLPVSSLKISTGASRTEVQLPAAVAFTRVSVEAGVAEVVINVPQGVAARIRLETGLSGKNINTARFPQLGGGYESPDYETAPNKVEIHVEAGVGSISVQ